MLLKLTTVRYLVSQTVHFEFVMQVTTLTNGRPFPEELNSAHAQCVAMETKGTRKVCSYV